MATTCGVYLFDEFDAIGSNRARPNEVGEMRRVLNSFLQFLEADESDSLILAATNNGEVLDPALFRRFDDVIRYHLPTPDEARLLIQDRLNTFRLTGVIWDKVKSAAKELSCAEISRACTEAAKVAVLTDSRELSTEDILSPLKERQSFRQQ
jgi:ATP-dependent 26S proteasome regulatory subunit